MRKNMKMLSVVSCGIVILLCFVYYTSYVSDIIFDLENPYLVMESCSAEKMDVWPEGYTVDYYGDYEDLADMEAVEVTWRLSNITNERKGADSSWASYDSMDGDRLYVMRKEPGNLAIADYENKKIIPAGEQGNLTEYVLVPAGAHGMKVRMYMTPASEERKTFTVSF